MVSAREGEDKTRTWESEKGRVRVEDASGIEVTTVRWRNYLWRCLKVQLGRAAVQGHDQE